MTISPAGRTFIESWETFRPTAYKPTPNDVWTIGYGSTHGVKQGDTCTLAQADAYLDQDLVEAEHLVDHAVLVPLSQNEYDACVSLCFNIEEPFTQRPATHFLSALNAGNRALAADQFLVWDHQGGKVLPGLLRRRQAERDLFLKEIA